MARCSKGEALETRERLLDAALEVFHTEGVSRPSLSKIAELAGVTRGAVYGHFENKADLFAALCDRILLPAEALADCGPPGSLDPLGLVRGWCVTVLRDSVSIPDKRRLLEVIFHKCELVEENGAISQRRMKTRQRGRAHLRALVSRAVEAGQLPAHLDVDFASGLVHDVVVGMLSQWLLEPWSYDLPAQAEQIADALVATLQRSAALG